MKNKNKPRVMWALYGSGRDSIVCGNLSLIRIYARSAGVKAIRVAVIPLDDVEAIVERANSAFQLDESFGFKDSLRAALTAAGIPCKRKARK
jgi:hypothetical protein